MPAIAACYHAAMSVSKQLLPDQRLGTQIAFRVNADLAQAVDDATEYLEKTCPGLRLTRSEAARIRLCKGLAVLAVDRSD